MESIENKRDYRRVREIALNAHFGFCRNVIVEPQPHSNIMGWLAYEFEYSYEDPVESIMVLLVRLVLTAGLHTELAKSLKSTIEKEIADFGIDNLIACVHGESGFDFKHDLEVMGFYKRQVVSYGI